MGPAWVFLFFSLVPDPPPTPPTSPGLVDVAPTIAALLHAPCPANAQGRALTEAFSGPAACT